MSALPPEPPAQHGATQRNSFAANSEATIHKFSEMPDLPPRQARAMELLLRGLSDAQVAEELGMDRGTIFRWRKEPAFAAQLQQLRRESWQESLDQLQNRYGDMTDFQNPGDMSHVPISPPTRVSRS